MILGLALPVEEASYFVKASQQVMILHSTAAKSLGTALVGFMNQERESPIDAIEIGQHLSKSPLRPEDLIMSSDGFSNENAPGLVIFTSGTTGPPKGAVWSRGTVREAAKIFMDTNSITSNDVVLHVLPVHHATGITITLTPFLMAGACIEFRSGSFNAEWMWNRWKQGGLTFFSAVPTIYMRLMRFFVRHIQPLPKETVAEFVRGANQFSGMFCGTSALPAPVQEFWTIMRNGKPMLTRYGGTEFGSVLAVGINDKGVPVGSVGRPMAGMEIKLSNGDEGEILTKSPVMFSKLVPSSSRYLAIANILRQICMRSGGDKN
jgi:malonyl-CoA/methylmalonyl-CoA synthetase